MTGSCFYLCSIKADCFVAIAQILFYNWQSYFVNFVSDFIIPKSLPNRVKLCIYFWF